ncbi:MAG: amidohydrolase family protein [Verrucomicrobia bacterium]|nr:amidohydrolase family protein [Verrucomicrobiota bacterium]
MDGPIVDIHAHAFPDALAARIVGPMAAEAGVPAAHAGTVGSLRDSMKRAGIALSVIMPVATKPEQVASVNRWVLDQNAAIGMAGGVAGGVISFGALHPLFDDAVGEVNRLADAGVLGAKFHPDYQRFRPDDGAMAPLYEAFVERDMIVLFHCGKDLSVPPPVMGTPERILAVHEAFPTMRLICAHFGGYEMWDEVEATLLGRDVWLDTSYTVGRLPDEQLVDMIRRHGVDRVLFGTDTPWDDQLKEVEALRRLALTDDEREAIFGLNAMALLGLDTLH